MFNRTEYDEFEEGYRKNKIGDHDEDEDDDEESSDSEDGNQNNNNNFK